MSDTLENPTTPAAPPPQDELTAASVVVSPLALDPAQVAAMRESWIAAGHPAEVFDETVGGAPPPEDTRTDDQREFDAAFGAAPPDAYRVDYMGRTPADMDAGLLAQANREITTWLSEVGFPPEIGPAVAEQALDASNRIGRMDDGEKELWGREQDALFDRVAGSPERALQLVKYAEAALAKGNAQFREILLKSGAIRDAGVMMHLALQGERMAARPGAAK